MNNGGSAFPKQPTVHHPDVGSVVMEQGGMSLRDYFAAKAMQAIIIGGDAAVYLKQRTVEEAAFAISDSMLLEREKS